MQIEQTIGRIPREFIDDLIARIDIVEVIDARVKLKKTGVNHGACCPFHSEKTPSFIVFSKNQNYHCFGCGAHGDVIRFIMDYEHLSYPEAIQTLASELGIEIPYENKVSKEKVHYKAFYEILDQASNYFQKQLREHPNKLQPINYLKQRGLTGELAKRYGLGYAPEGWSLLHDYFSQLGIEDNLLEEVGLLIHKEEKNKYDRFRNRIMFPIRNHRGQVVGFGGRVLDDSKPKYLNSPETEVFHKRRELYGLYESRQFSERLDSLIVVEGYTDVLALAQAGITNVVATLGTSVTANHLNRLFRICKEIIFCFDGDMAGKKAAWRVIDPLFSQYEDGLKISFIFLPEKEDPDSLVRKIGANAFLQSVKEATPLSDFFFQEVQSQVGQDGLSPENLEGSASFAKQASGYISKLPHCLFRQLLMQKLAEKVNMHVDDIKEYVDSIYTSTKEKPLPGKIHINSSKSPPLISHQTIGVLLKDPQLVENYENFDWLLEADITDIELLHELIRVIKVKNLKTTTDILTQFDGQKKQAQFNSCLKYAEIVPRTGLAEELEGALRKIKEHCLSKKYRQLLKKSKVTKLSSGEKRELVLLIEEMNQYKIVS